MQIIKRINDYNRITDLFEQHYVKYYVIIGTAAITLPTNTELWLDSDSTICTQHSVYVNDIQRALEKTALLPGY